MKIFDQTPFYTFDDYRLFMAEPDDLELATLWTAADPHHRGRVNPSFWLEHSPGTESYVLCDREGPVYFVRLQRTIHEYMQECKEGSIEPSKVKYLPALELHLQFAPPQRGNGSETPHAVSHLRTATALKDGLDWLTGMLKTSDVSLLRFDSQNPALTEFSRQRLGFVLRDNILLKWITPPESGEQELGTGS